jgi:hypothetical protein
MGSFSPWGWRKMSSEEDLEMRFYPFPHSDFVLKQFMKITFICVYLNTLYVIVIYISYNACINLFLCDIYYCHNSQTHNNVLISYLFYD